MASAVTLVNPSFEAPAIDSNVQSFFATQTIPGWTIGGDGIDILGASLGIATDGAQSLDLNRNTAGSISQTVSGLSAGQRYLVSFDVTASPEAGGFRGPLTRRFNVAVDGDGTDFDFTPAGSSALESFERLTFGFTATASEAALSFTALTPGTRGAIIDDVEISAVPLPPSALLFAGALGLLGLSRRRARG